MDNELQLIGLTKTETKIYISLLKIGKAQAGIISRKTGIHRRTVYDSLERLIEKGLVSYIRENENRFYIAEDPVRIREIINQQKDEIEKVLPDLKIIFNENKQKSETKFYKGKDGIRTVFEDQIEEGKPVFIISTPDYAKEILKYYIPHYTARRIKKQLKLNIIYAGKKKDSEIPNGEVRYLPETYASPVSTNIYADKIAIIVWSNDPVAILIKDKDVAKSYKNYFDLLWNIAKP